MLRRSLAPDLIRGNQALVTWGWCDWSRGWRADGQMNRAGKRGHGGEESIGFLSPPLLEAGAPPLCAYRRVTDLSLCMLPQGHRQIGKVTVLPGPDPEAKETEAPCWRPSAFWVGRKPAGCLPKSCCVGEGVQYTRCVQQAHPSCPIKFKMLLNTDKAEHPWKSSRPGCSAGDPAWHWGLCLLPSWGHPHAQCTLRTCWRTSTQGCPRAKVHAVQSCFSPGLSFPRPASSWPGSEPRPRSSGCCLFSILSRWRSFHWDRSAVKWGQLQQDVDKQTRTHASTSKPVSLWRVQMQREIFWLQTKCKIILQGTESSSSWPHPLLSKSKRGPRSFTC